MEIISVIGVSDRNVIPDQCNKPVSNNPLKLSANKPCAWHQLFREDPFLFQNSNFFFIKSK